MKPRRKKVTKTVAYYILSVYTIHVTYESYSLSRLQFVCLLHVISVILLGCGNTMLSDLFFVRTRYFVKVMFDYTIILMMKKWFPCIPNSPPRF